MALLDVLIPQMGEGLQEVVIVGFHKKPGDAIKRDEPLYSMETDKAVMDVESPYEGELVEWLAQEGNVLHIGTPVARIESVTGTVAPAALPSSIASDAAAILSVSPSHRPNVSRSDLVIPPRTRALCKEKGISEEEMHSIPASGGKLMPADVEAYIEIRDQRSEGRGHPSSLILADRSADKGTREEGNLRAEAQIWVPTSEGTGEREESKGQQAEGTGSVSTVGLGYTERPLTPQQRVFTSRIRRSSALVIPATMTRPVLWEPVVECTKSAREQDFTFRPTEFQTLAWCVAQAAGIHPKLRSTLQGDESVREYEHVNLGVAVALKTGELVTAVVRDADKLDYHDFVHELQSAITMAREGKDQADSATQLHLTYLGGYGITEGIPVLVSPAIGVLFVGAQYPRDGASWVNLTLTFDHRLINGVEGAQFLKTVVETIGKLPEIT